MQKTTRRDFLRTSAVIASPLLIPFGSIFGDDANAAPNNRTTIAHFGVGNQGGGLARAFLGCKDAQCVAAADCYKSRRDGMAAVFNGKSYGDFRELLDKEDVDAVIIATPDHWHVPLGLYAARKKKHVYIEKPLGLTIEQNLLFKKVAAENKTCFQYGTQQRSDRHCWLGCALVRSGVIGEVKAIEVDAPDGHGGGSTTEAPVPADIDFEMWTGPAPAAPYTVDRCKPDATYMVYDYSIGYLGGWGAHPLDIMVWGSEADLSGPIVVEGTGQHNDNDLCNAVFNWDMKIKLGNVDLIFRPGGDRTRFIGENGRWIEVRRNGNSASDPALLEAVPKEDALVWHSDGNHYNNFVQSVRNGKTPVSHLTDAVRSDNISQLCDIAVRTKSVVKWDPIKMELIAPTSEQKKMLSRPMRAPWTL